jgi:hypothetical protein
LISPCRGVNALLARYLLGGRLHGQAPGYLRPILGRSVAPTRHPASCGTDPAGRIRVGRVGLAGKLSLAGFSGLAGLTQPLGQGAGRRCGSSRGAGRAAAGPGRPVVQPHALEVLRITSSPGRPRTRTRYSRSTSADGCMSPSGSRRVVTSPTGL